VILKSIGKQTALAAPNSWRLIWWSKRKLSLNGRTEGIIFIAFLQYCTFRSDFNMPPGIAPDDVLVKVSTEGQTSPLA